MSRHLQDIDNIFKNAYQEHKEPPSDGAWQKIAEHLGRQKNKKFRIRKVEWRYAAVFLLCILCALALDQTPRKSFYRGNMPVASRQNQAPQGGTDLSLFQSTADPDFVLPKKRMKISNSIDPTLTADGIKESITKEEASNSQLIYQPIKAIETRTVDTDAGVQQKWLGSLGQQNTRQLPKVSPIGALEIPNRPFKPYWTITAFASNDWANYRLDADFPDEIEKISRRESLENSFSVGLLATRQITRHWAVKTGLMYSNTAIAIGPQEIYAMKEENGNIAFKFITSSGYSFLKPKFGSSPAIGDSLKSAEAQHNLSFLSVPVMISYKFASCNRWSLASSAGLSLNFLTKAAVQTEVTDLQNRETVNINKLKGLKHVSVGITADLNIQYQVNAKWSINLQPNIRYSITPITYTHIVKTYPYSVGLGAGITYKL